MDNKRTLNLYNLSHQYNTTAASDTILKYDAFECLRSSHFVAKDILKYLGIIPQREIHNCIQISKSIGGDFVTICKNLNCSQYHPESRIKNPMRNDRMHDAYRLAVFD
jgi:hypothetical protein